MATPLDELAYIDRIRVYNEPNEITDPKEDGATVSKQQRYTGDVRVIDVPQSLIDTSEDTPAEKQAGTTLRQRVIAFDESHKTVVPFDWTNPDTGEVLRVTLEGRLRLVKDPRFPDRYTVENFTLREHKNGW